MQTSAEYSYVLSHSLFSHTYHLTVDLDIKTNALLLVFWDETNVFSLEFCIKLPYGDMYIIPTNTVKSDVDIVGYLVLEIKVAVDRPPYKLL